MQWQKVHSQPPSLFHNITNFSQIACCCHGIILLLPSCCRLTSFSCTNMVDVEQLSTGMINSLIFSVACNTESYLQLCTFSLNMIVHMNTIASVIFISHCFTYTCTMVNQSFSLPWLCIGVESKSEV